MRRGRLINIHELRQELMRYKYTGRYNIDRAKSFIKDCGYTLKGDRIMYKGRYTSVNLVETSSSWFIR